MPWNTPSQANTVTVTLGGQKTRCDAWYAALQSDPRFRVTFVSYEPNDLRAKLNAYSEALLLDASMFADAREVIQLISTLQDTCIYVLIPPDASDHDRQAILQAGNVRACERQDLNLTRLLGKMYADALAAREANGGLWQAAPEQVARVALRVIAVWNQAGGVGKTTVATNLATEAARRGLPTLLIGLAGPDDLPFTMGLHREPNLLTWCTNPTPEGLLMALQGRHKLRVLAGFPDVMTEAQHTPVFTAPAGGKGSLPDLVSQAIDSGFTTIILDCPHNPLAASALSVAKVLVLVARPTLPDVLRTTEAYKTLTVHMQGEHRIPPNGMYLVLNQVNGRMEPARWHRYACEGLEKSFPPVVAQVPYLPQVGKAHDRRELPTEEAFVKSLRPLADALFGVESQEPAPTMGKATQKGQKSLRLGPVKIKI